MATSRAYMEFILDQLPEGCRARSMMGEYLVYYRDKVAANLCDDRLLVKPVPAALELLDPPVWAVPYEGAREMLLVENVEDRDFLARLMEAIYPQLPAPKPKKKRSPA